MTDSAYIKEQQALIDREILFKAELESERLSKEDAQYWENPLPDEARTLCCDDCGKGYASCKCVIEWATKEARAKRQEEIQDIKRTILKEINEQQVRGPFARIEKVKLRVPESFAEALLTHAKIARMTTSHFAALLLRSHSENTGELRSWGLTIRLSLSLPECIVQRARLRAKHEKTTANELMVRHLQKELFSLLKNSDGFLLT